MTFNKLKYLTSTCCHEKHQPLTIDLTRFNNTAQYRLGLTRLFVPDWFPF